MRSRVTIRFYISHLALSATSTRIGQEAEQQACKKENSHPKPHSWRSYETHPKAQLDGVQEKNVVTGDCATKS
jgi:hypothetical protein